MRKYHLSFVAVSSSSSSSPLVFSFCSCITLPSPVNVFHHAQSLCVSVVLSLSVWWRMENNPCIRPRFLRIDQKQTKEATRQIPKYCIFRILNQWTVTFQQCLDDKHMWKVRFQKQHRQQLLYLLIYQLCNLMKIKFSPHPQSHQQET